MENMKITAKGIKREARGLLNNNWSRALGTLCINLMVTVLFVQLSQLSTALLREYGPAAGVDASELKTFSDYLNFFTSGGMGLNVLILLAMAGFFFVLSAPISLGVTYWYRKLILLDNLQVGQIFRYYQRNDLFVNAVIFQALNTVLNVIFAVISFLPSVVCFAFAYINGRAADGTAPNNSTMLAILGCVLVVGGLFLFLALSLRLFFARYLFCGDYGYGAFDCIKYSNRYMKKHIGRVMGVILSFVPWFISCIFILPLAYVIPFFNASMAACAQDIIDQHMGDTLAQLAERRDRHNAG